MCAIRALGLADGRIAMKPFQNGVGRSILATGAVRLHVGSEFPRP